jgi:hypothetical protein
MSHRGDALRLAIYLDTAGLVPDCQKCRTWDEVVAALSVQFFSLPAEVRRDAKAHSGYVMSQASLTEIGRAILRDHPLFNEIPDHSCGPPRPKCDHCRKPTWDSREAAVRFCRVNAMTGLESVEPFPCPVHEGKWHIARKRNSANSPPGRKKG